MSPHARRKPSAGPVHSHIIVDQRRGTRNIFSHEPPVVGASLRTPAALIVSCRVLLVDHLGVPGMIRAARLARRAGIPVVADIESDRAPANPPTPGPGRPSDRLPRVCREAHRRQVPGTGRPQTGPPRPAGRGGDLRRPKAAGIWRRAGPCPNINPPSRSRRWIPPAAATCSTGRMPLPWPGAWRWKNGFASPPPPPP